jgi:hypothetical protein
MRALARVIEEHPFAGWSSSPAASRSDHSAQSSSSPGYSDSSKPKEANFNPAYIVVPAVIMMLAIILGFITAWLRKRYEWGNKKKTVITPAETVCLQQKLFWRFSEDFEDSFSLCSLSGSHDAGRYHWIRSLLPEAPRMG